jgi:hypothetical protein
MMFDDEDWKRLQLERQKEQSRYEAELARTLQGPKEKYEMINNLRQLKTVTNDALQQNRARTLSLQLALLGQRLFAGVTTDETDQDRPALLDLLRINAFYQSVLTGQNLTSVQVEELQLTADTPQIDEAWEQLKNEPVRRQMLVLLFLYYRDLMSNMRQQRHTVPQFVTRQLLHITDLYDALDLLPGGTQHGAALLDAVSKRLAVPNPQQDLARIYETKTGEVDWQGLFANTETLRLDKWTLLKVPQAQEEELAGVGCAHDYGDLYPQYCQNMLTYLYGDAVERISVQDEAIARGKGQLPLRWRSNDAETGGHPPAVVELIRLAVPEFFSASASTASTSTTSTTTTSSTTGTLKSAELAVAESVVRSHLLWLGFENIRWDQLLDLVLGGQAAPDIQSIKTRLMNGTLHNALDPLQTVLESLWTLYQPLLVHYYTQLLDELQQHNVVAIPPILQKQLQALRQDPFTSDGLTQLLQLFQEMPLEQLIIDARFKRYLETEGQSIAPTTTTTGNNKKRRVKQLEQLQRQQLGQPELHMHYLAQQYGDYVDSFTEELMRQVAQTDEAIQNATERLNRMVGDETIGGGSSSTAQRPVYVQRKAFTSQAINSGLVHLRPEVVSIISTAYFNVQRYCPKLKGLPLEAFKTTQAYECGLTTCFIKYVAASYAYESLSYPDTYKAQEQYRHNTQLQTDALGRLQRDFAYRRLYGEHYTILNSSGQKTDTRQLQLQYFEKLHACGVDTEPFDTYNMGCF